MLEIIRLESSEHGMFGVLKVDGRVLCVTLEPPWLDNQVNISCIPDGEYECHRFKSYQHGETFIVENVPGRSGILFHVGNTISDTSGCILLGTAFGERCIRKSREAMSLFRSTLKDCDLVKLKIKEVFE